MYRPGTRVRFKNMTGKFAHLDGKEGEIEKVNTKSISVGYGKRDEFGYEHYVNASQDFLELV